MVEEKNFNLSDKDISDVCKKECEDVYIECIQYCSNSDCYYACGRALSDCSDGKND